MSETPQHAQDTQRIWKEIWEWVRLIVGTLLAALIVHQFVFTLARVDGTSMNDGLQDQQLLAVFRVTYLLRDPQRGEVVICRYPGWEEDCVKRVIGLPGDRVRVEDSRVYVNDIPLDEPYLTRPDTSDFAEITVPEGEYFVMGDNRRVSQDSRSVGSIPRSDVKGKCMAVVWPVSDWAGIR